MTRIEQAAYVSASAILTGAAYREAGLPFSYPIEFARCFPSGCPVGYRSEAGRIARQLYDMGFDVEVSALTSPDTGTRETIVFRLT